MEATVEENAVWRSGIAGITVTGGTDSSDGNTVTADVNDNLVARTTALSSGSAGYGLYLRAAAGVPDATSTSSNNTLTITGQGNIINIRRNSSDTTGYDIFRTKNNNTNRLNNVSTDTLKAALLTPGCKIGNNDKCQGGDSDLPKTDEAELVKPVDTSGNTEVDDFTFIPTSDDALPKTKFTAGGQVFDITMLDSDDDEITEPLDTAVTVCLPIPEGVSNPRIHRYNRDTDSWEALPSTVSNGQVCANVTQFSLFTTGTYTTGGGGGRWWWRWWRGWRGVVVPPSPPVLQGFFESPAPGATVSGVDIIRGWSFSEAARIGIEQVALFIDGQRYAVIPCCSTRPDVAQAKPDFPSANTSQSGWGITLNWGNLSAGPHSLQVVATGTDEGRWASDLHTVTVLKPGDIAFADRFSLAEAEARLEGDTLLLTGAVLRDAQTQTEQEVVLRYAWQTGAQGLRLVASRTTRGGPGSARRCGAAAGWRPGVGAAVVESE